MADVVKISLELADEKALASLKELIKNGDISAKKLQELGSTGKATFDEISVGIGKSIGVFDIFAGNIAANVVLGAFNAMKDAAVGLFNTFVVDGIKAAEESETALKQLNLALAQAGHYSNKTSEDFQNFAKQIQSTTAFEDDAVIKNAALIESLTQLDQNGLKRATSAAVNLSSALGIDLDTASRTVAKAAEGNTTALHKMGIEIQKGATNAETFANAMTAIEGKIGNRAAAEVNTYAGAVAQAGNTFGDLQEDIGGLLVQNPAVVETIKAVSNIFRDLSGVLGENSLSVKSFIAEGLIVLIDTSKLVVDTFNVLYKSGNFVFAGLEAAIYGFAAAYFNLVGKIDDESAAIGEEMTASFENASKKIATAFDTNGIDEVSLKLAGIGSAARGGFESMGAAATHASESLENNKTKVKELSEEQLKAIENNKKYVEGLAEKTDETANEAKVEALKLYYETRNQIENENDSKQFQVRIDNETTYLNARQQILDAQFNKDVDRINSSTATETQKNAALLTLQNKFQLDSLKLAEDADKNQRKIGLDKHKFDLDMSKQKQEEVRSALGYVANLTASSDRELFEIGKAAALANAYIDGQAAVLKALASAPPPFNFALAGLVGVAVGANIARIAASQPPKYADGGIVPGSSFSGDNVIARVNSGEMILNQGQQANLFNAVDGGNLGGSGIVGELRALRQDIKALQTVVQIDGKEVFSVILGELNKGRSFA